MSPFLKSLRVLLTLLCLLTVAVARARVATVCTGKQPSLAVTAQGRLHLAYEGPRAGNDIYYRGSADGQTWSDEVNISNSSGISSEPALAVEKGGAVEVVWADTSSGADRPDIYFSRSSDEGKTWSAALDLSHTPRLSRSPSLAVGPDDSLHVCWVDTSRGLPVPDLYYVFSYNHGQSWSKPALISGATGVSSRPALAVAPDGVVHVAWADGARRPLIRYIRGQADGWSPPQTLGSGFCSQPRLAAGTASKVYLSWIGQLRPDQSPNVYLCQPGGGRPVNVSKTPGTSSDPVLAVAGSRPLSCWIDTTAGARTPDVWVSLGGRVFDISRTPGVSRMPALAAAGSKAWVLWEELELGNCSLKLSSVPVRRK